MTIKTISVSALKATLSEQLRLVKRGERLAVQERGRSIALLVPLPAADGAEGRIERLAAQGLVLAPSASLPADFLSAELPPCAGDPLSQAVRQDRDEGW